MHGEIDRLNAALAGRYRIERELGAGGMATVYLAKDERHDRSVALKVLRPELAAVIGAERFLVEIKTTANLQHPNILPLHDSGELSGTVWYVMPLVEGESLRDRLSRETQLPIDDALTIAREVASALDYAHRHGVVHRDIKPENILLHDGRAVVADFGIALAVARTDGGTRLTETGMSLGTPHYMSPEQALGERTVDARTDVYALGAVVYEMLTGEPPFTGPTAQSIIAKVMNARPAPVAGARPSVPVGIDVAVLRALEKLPADRYRSAADFGAALQAGITGTTAAVASPTGAAGSVTSRSTSLARHAPWVVAAAAVVLAAAIGLQRAPPNAERVTAAVIPLEIRTPKNLPLNEVGSPISIAPDGSFIVFVGADPDSIGGTALWVRRLDALTATMIPGTRGAQAPVISRDGKAVQFLTRAPSRNANLRWEASFDGALPQQIPAVLGFRRVRDGSAIVLVDSTIARVPAGGDMPGRLAGRMAGRIAIAVSPDVRWAARTRRQGLRDSIVMISVKDNTRHVIAQGSTPAFLDNDLLAFRADDGTLLVGKLSRDRSGFEAPPLPMVSSVARAFDDGAIYDIADDGTLIYVVGGSASQSRPVWVENGRERVVPNAESRVYGGVSISRDGLRAAVTVGAIATGGDILIANLAIGSMSPLTSDGISSRATWTQNGQAVTYLHPAMSQTAGLDSLARPRLYRRNPDSGAPADSVLIPWTRRLVDELDWSPDMQHLAIRVRGGVPATRDIVVWRVGTDTITPFAAEPAQERNPRFSPDGKWLLYVSDRSGPDEVYAESFPRGGNRVQLSTGGGTEAIWSRDGTRVFYRGADGWMMAAHVTRGERLALARSERLFDANAYLKNQFLPMYDVAPGDRFLMFKLVGEQERTDVVIIRNWVQQVRARLAGRSN